jgi:hypothetical protein
LAQDSILITESINPKRYTHERRNIKEIGNNYVDNNTMWIIVAVILAFVFAGALNKASKDGSEISVYNSNGINIGSTLSNNGKARIVVPRQFGTTAIVKIGEKAIKVLLR